MDSFETVLIKVKNEIHRRERERFKKLKGRLTDEDKQKIKSLKGAEFKFEFIQTMYLKYNIPEDLSPIVNEFSIE